MDSLDILLLPSTLISIIVWAIDREEMKKKIKLILIIVLNIRFYIVNLLIFKLT